MEASSTYLDSPKNVLEIGANRGRLSNYILEKYKPELFLPTDKFLAKGNTLPKALLDGEQLPFKEARFDWIVSGGTFQWFESLALSLKNFRAYLKPKGTLSFSYFLKESMEPLASGIKSLGDEGRLLKLNEEPYLKQCLSESKLNILDYHVIEGVDYFESMSSMLQHLRFIGATHSNGHHNLRSKDFRALDAYLKHKKELQGLPLKWKAATVVLTV